jgi:hypothetical protein
MNDLTDGTPYAEVITAEEIYQLGRQHGAEQERAAVIQLLNEMALGRDDVDDIIFTARIIIKAGGHRAVKP